MKNALLSTGALFVLLSHGACGGLPAPGEEAHEPRTVSSAALALPGCSPLAILSVSANGNDGNLPVQTLDDQLDTRWSQLGKGAWIDYDLGSHRAVAGAAIAWHQGNLRRSTFTVSVSSDGRTYVPVYSGVSSGTTAAAELYPFIPYTARNVRLTVQGNSLNDWASIAEVRVCGQTDSALPLPAASLTWRGDFETGNRSQWTALQEVSPDRLQVVPLPMREGRYALKTTVKQGDDPIASGGNRNELVLATYEPVGSEYIYSWSTMFAPDFPSVQTWQLFTQWHHEGCCGSPPVEFYVFGEEIRLSVGGSTGSLVWRTPLVRGVWHDFVFRVKWSPDPKTGFIQLFHNGRQAVPQRAMATQFPGMLNYLKVGLYRSDTVTQDGVVYHDNWTMARRMDNVPLPTDWPPEGLP
ncbi:heparin lyase I family protein [Stigmatella sp. ncwal1]|uniref:Heparin lyase I family protein n=1 Tax=Stigmatella ashevillensis TaxID=2995309 RepID=A0ABT5DI75_9BACT|nr:heparin lyase I family protein [Stigmatella ashevillena]MDC0712850.1 heparin lyase I family protein [Stigmatella ashevillena]